MRQVLRRTCLVPVLLATSTVLVGCQQSDDEARQDYCEEVAEVAPELSRISDEGGPGAFLEALPLLEDLADSAPGDISDEWTVFLDALRGLRDVLAEVGLDPSEMSGNGLPDDLPKDQRRRVRAQASVLTSPDVTAATAGIQQHALDVCETPIM